MYNSLRGIIARLLQRLFGLLPLQDKIVYSCFDGKSYGDNPKAIFDWLIRGVSKAKMVWLLRDTSKEIDGAVVVKAYSWKAIYHQATAKIWIYNSRQRAWIRKRRGQYYIQTWHGTLPLKRIEKDCMDSLPQSYIEAARHDSQMADLFLSSCAWCTDNYRQAFWYDGEIAEFGLPRTDALFGDKDQAKSEICRRFGVKEDARFIVYAPTFRGENQCGAYDVDWQQVLDAARLRWPGEWKVIVKLHPNIDRQQVTSLCDGRTVLDGSDTEDLNKLILGSDILITDYSSCMFDGMMAKKLVMLYAPDHEIYESERGFYFKLDELPFLMVENSEALSECIQNYTEASYENKVADFMNRIRFFDDGHATEHITKLIEEKLA